MQQLALLVVPGSTSYRSMLEAQLDTAAYRLDFATDLETTFARTQVTSPDLILLDADLEEPHWHDYQARLQADERTARIPLIVLMRAEQLTSTLR